MKKYPKEWLDALGFTATYKGVGGEDITLISNPVEFLCKLDSVGALKDIPPPKEIYFCKKCGGYSNDQQSFEFCCKEKTILMREVLE